MSVILNEVALTALLKAPESPTMRMIERRADAAAAALQTRIDQIISNPVVRPQATVKMTEDGAIIGIPDQGSIADYLGFKLGIFRENWWIDVGEAAARGAV